jgi:hypothetical protein
VVLHPSTFPYTGGFYHTGTSLTFFFIKTWQ